MMLARVAESLYWIGRYVERAEHMCRLSDVMLNATLDRSEAATTVARIALTAVGDDEPSKTTRPYDSALDLTLNREDGGSVVSSVSRARENARQVRDQITSETWERLNIIYLRLTAPDAQETFAEGSQAFLHETIADLHLFKGAADSTMSHGEGWILLLGVYLERAQLIGSLLDVCFGERRRRAISDHFALTSVLRMGCALEPYLREYTAEMQPRYILQFLMLDEAFPRSMRFCTNQIEAHLAAITRNAGLGAQSAPDRLAGRLRSRLQYADLDELEAQGPSAFLRTVLDECAAIHRTLYDTFVAYPLELRLPA